MSMPPLTTSSSDPLDPAHWDGLPFPSRTLGHLFGRLVRRGAQGSRGLLARLGILAIRRAWLAWVCGVTLFAGGALLLMGLYLLLTDAIWPMLAWTMSGLDPQRELPAALRGGLGLLVVVLVLLVLRLAMMLFVDYPARFWVALSMMAQAPDSIPVEHRTQARRWLNGQGVVRGIAAVLMLGLGVVAFNARSEILAGTRSAIHELASACRPTLVVTVPPAPGESPSALPGHLSDRIDQEITQVEQGQVAGFDLTPLAELGPQAIDDQKNPWLDLDSASQRQVLANPGTLATWALLNALDQRVNRLTIDGGNLRAAAQASGNATKAQAIEADHRQRLDRLSTALWLLNATHLTEVNQVIVMQDIMANGNNPYNALLNEPSNNVEGGRLANTYGCVLRIDASDLYPVKHLSPTGMAAFSTVEQRLKGLDQKHRWCGVQGRGWDALHLTEMQDRNTEP